MRRTLTTAAVCLLAAATAAAAEIDKARKLVRIGDYAAALVELHELAKADPENTEVRVLMARSFAECAFDLKMPGAVTVGLSNQERALYQLAILAKIGKPGQDVLLDLVGGRDKVAPLAMRVAVKEKAPGAVRAIAAAITREDADPDSAQAGIIALAQAPGEESAAVIKKFLDREKNDARRRWLASFYVGCLDDKALVNVAATSADDAVLEQLSHRLREAAADAWVALAKREDLAPRWRLDALGRLSRLKDAPKAEFRALVELLVADKSVEVRWAATEQLARLAPEKAAKPLVAALADKKTASDAIRIIQDLKDKALAPELMKVLEERCDEKKFKNWVVTREQVYHALVACGAEGDVLVRAVRLMLAPDPARTEPLRGWQPPLTLPYIPRERLGQVAGALLADGDVEVRRAAARALATGDVKDALDPALKALDDKDADVRHTAERVVLQYARAGQVKPDVMAKLLRSDEAWVVSNAARALVTKPDKAAADAMLELLKDDKRAVHAQRELAEFFAAVPDDRAVQPLAAVIMSEQPVMPVELAAAALKKCAKDTAAEQVIKGLTHKSSQVRTNAAVALKLIGEKWVLPDLLDAAQKAQSPVERRVIDDAIKALTDKK